MEKELLSSKDKVTCYWNDSVFYIAPKVFYETLLRQKEGPKPYVRYKTGAELFDVGRGEFIKLARDAEAVHKHNGTALVNLDAVCKYVESLDSGEN